MKKELALIICLFGLFSLKAQDGFHLGLSFSPNISWVNPDTRGIESDGSRLGFKYGVISDFIFAENYSFSSGIFIVHTGGTTNIPSIATETTPPSNGFLQSDIRLQYLEIPITLKLRTNEIGYITYYGQIGVGANINIDAKSDLSFQDLNGNEVYSIKDESISDEINTIMANLIIGAGAEYNVSGNTKIIAGLSFHNGFTNIFDFDVPSVDRSGNFVAGETKKAQAIVNYVSLNLGVLF